MHAPDCLGALLFPRRGNAGRGVEVSSAPLHDARGATPAPRQQRTARMRVRPPLAFAGVVLPTRYPDTPRSCHPASTHGRFERWRADAFASPVPP